MLCLCGPVFCVPNVANVSGLSIFDLPFSFLQSLFIKQTWTPSSVWSVIKNVSLFYELLYAHHLVKAQFGHTCHICGYNRLDELII